MFADEKRQILLLVGAGTAVLVMIAAAVLLLDVRSLVQTNAPQVEAAISNVVYEALPDMRPRFDDAGNFIEYEEDYQLPRGVDMRGKLQRGQTVGGSVGMDRMEGWVLDARQGEQYLLDFEQLEGGYYWQMTVYKPDRNMLAFTADSDAGYADFTQLLVDIPADGLYVVVLSGFGESDGEYALAVY